IGVDFASFHTVAENPHPMPSQQPYPPHQLHHSPVQAQTPNPLISNEAVPTQDGPQTTPQLAINLNQSVVDPGGDAPGFLGLSSSPEALMNALNLLQQNISALQSLIPLMAQQQQQQPIDSAHAEQLKQQHAAASAGIASVISQLALAAANILPQMGLPAPVNVTSTKIPPANVRSGVFQSRNSNVGNLQLASVQPSHPGVAAFPSLDPHPDLNNLQRQHQPILEHQSPQILQGTPAGFAWQDLGFQMLESQSQSARNAEKATAQLQLVLASLSSAAAESVKLQQDQLKSVVSQEEQHQHLRPQQQQQQQHIQPQMTVSPSEDTSPLAIASQLPRKRKSLEPATVAPAADAGQGNPATSPPGDEGDDEGEVLAGEFNIIQMDPVELLAEHTHFCEICGKGFKRDANLRMHMRGHGDEYKTPAALANPEKSMLSRTDTTAVTEKKPLRYSCPFDGCKRNQQHRAFVPLKTMLCVKNHYRRTHCPKMLSCSKCGAKRFSVVADLKTHEKHCGRDRWLCSCGTSFSRKDKLLGHLALFKGHRPANPSLTAADDGPAGAKPTLAAAPHDAAAVSPMIFGSSFPQPEQQPGYQPEQRALADLVTADLLGSAEKAARLVR
ncbi:unnamed protein product, partial [Closterium sp. Naga37s-1]